jgi:hypothetical protein
MACVTATGVPSAGTHAKMRRDTNPSSPTSPAAMGFVPRKSNRSQPSSDASRSAAWKLGSVSGVSMAES